MRQASMRQEVSDIGIFQKIDTWKRLRFLDVNLYINIAKNVMAINHLKNLG